MKNKKENLSRHLKTIAQIASRAINAIVLIISYPVVLNSLGVDLFGVWVTIASFQGVLLFVDLGIGNALINETARHLAKGKTDLAKKVLYTAQIIHGIAATALLLGAIFFIKLYDSSKLFGALTVPISAQEINDGLAAYMLIFCLSMIASAPLKFLAAAQRHELAAYATIIGSVVYLIFIFVFSYFQAQFWVYCALLPMPPLISGLIAQIVCNNFSAQRLPKGPRFSKVIAKDLMRTGALFFVLQLVGALAMNSDQLIVAHRYGSAIAAEYSTIFRLFSFSTIVISLAQNQLWPAYAAALASGDKQWAVATLKKSILESIAASFILTGVLICFADNILKKWMGESIGLDKNAVLAIAAWTFLTSVGNAYAMYLNGNSIIRHQIVVATVFLFACLPAKILLSGSYNYWIVPAVGTLVYFFTTLVPNMVKTKKLSESQK